MFKKKKIEEKYVEPAKPKNRVLKVFKESRLVVVYEPLFTDSKGKIISYSNILVIEKLDKNAMSEPFYREDFRETVIGGFASHGDYYREQVNKMFKFFREIYLNE